MFTYPFLVSVSGGLGICFMQLTPEKIDVNPFLIFWHRTKSSIEGIVLEDGANFEIRR